ncbi:hypothetical protein HanHA300_Chr07g0257901 [Helianthus annuus]|nr:hypothetical protein HanHA300_Chr07g0257901 [Helianthus annuus]KAJ0732534.1 hypothetical protein HanOQP8_Chr07g0264261 [Helianthus annuus]
MHFPYLLKDEYMLHTYIYNLSSPQVMDDGQRVSLILQDPCFLCPTRKKTVSLITGDPGGIRDQAPA